MVFSFNEHEKFKFTRDVPAELIRYMLPGSEVSAISNEYLKLLLQEFYSTNCKVFYTVYLVDKKTSFRVRDEVPLLFACLALQQARHLKITGLGNVLIREGQFNIVYTPQRDMISSHKEGREYITMAVQYDLQVLQEWAPYFPRLQAFLKKVQAGEPATLLNSPEWLTLEIQDIVYRIMHCPPELSSNKPYFDLLLKSLLFHLLNQTVQKLPASNYTHYEIDGIQTARLMIEKNILDHFIIREISQKVGMNEFKLKNGFRKLFGNGVYEYRRTGRLAEAYQLLSEHGKNVQETARLTGYKSVNSFIKAFKKKYGKTPGAYRRRA